SEHYVEVTFNGSVGADMADPGRYSITTQDGTPLAVHDARRGDDPTTVILTTDAQQPVVYQLRMQTSPNVATITAAIATTGNEPALRTAIALNNTQVLLTFSDPLATSATNLSGNGAPFYHI